MKTLSKIIPLTLTLAVFSCNEKVASELENAAAADPTSSGTTSGSSGGSSDATNYTFKITTPSGLNYKLHKTGFSSAAATGSKRTLPCEVTGPANTPLSNDLYDPEGKVTGSVPDYAHDDKNYDISCFLEAEELALYHSGFEIKIDASPNACDYVGYSPFSYFSWIPGDSSTVYKTITCPDGTTASKDPTTHHGLDCDEYMNMNGSAPMYESSPGVGVKLTSTPTSDAQLCRFDYTAFDGPNCDVGTVTVVEHTYEVDPMDPTLLIESSSSPNTRVINCGGKVASCVSGPIRLLSEASDASRFTEISLVTEGEPWERTIDFPGLIEEQYGSNLKYVNFRRDLANPNFNYLDRSSGGSTAALDLELALQDYKNAFDPANHGGADDAFNLWERTFDPNFVENYSRNRRVVYPLSNANQYIDTTGPEYLDLYKNQGYRARPYASEPFQSVSNWRINPFYTFYCLDSAFQNKARIRLVVREWDKIFGNPATSTDFDYLSDIFKDLSPISPPSQDNYQTDSYGEEINHFADWDDFLHMQRTPGTFVAATTDFIPMIYRPLSDGSWIYANALWDPVTETNDSENARFNINIFPLDDE